VQARAEVTACGELLLGHLAGLGLAADGRHQQHGGDDGDDDEGRQRPLAIGAHGLTPLRTGDDACSVSRVRGTYREPRSPSGE
jgi:hypothetical protein